MLMKAVFHYIAALALSVMATGCSHPGASNAVRASGAKPVATRLSQGEVTRIAAFAATEQGYQLAEYNHPRVRFAFFGPKDKTWTVFYDGKGPAPPGHDFLVWVDDQTGAARVMRGE